MKLTNKQIAKLKPSPLLKSLPDTLKDPRCFKRVEKRLQLALKSDHTHKSMGAYAKCERCQVKRMAKQKLMKEIGFASFAQYLEWRKIIGMMIEIRKLRAKK